MRDIGKDANCVTIDCSDPDHSNDLWCCDRRHAKDKELWDMLAEGLCVTEEGEIHCNMLMTNLYPKIKTYIDAKYHEKGAHYT